MICCVVYLLRIFKMFHGLTKNPVLIINYVIIIKSISTIMYTVLHVDKYKITFELIINHCTNEILVTDTCYTNVISTFWV